MMRSLSKRLCLACLLVISPGMVLAAVQISVVGLFNGKAVLVVDNGKLVGTSTANQDSPYMDGQIPIFGIDVWEHAYYLKYQNRRPDYLKEIWKVVNWAVVGENYEKAIG